MTTSTACGALLRPADIDRLQRRSTKVLLASQVFAGAGLAAGVTVGALLAEDMLGSSSLSGLPAALFTLGSAGAAFVVGALSNRHGRRVGLAAGYLAGTAGGIGVTLAAVLDSPALLFAALMVYGAGTATNLQARYAGGDLATSDRRGTAISMILLGTTVGAVAGPNLVAVTGHLAQQVDVPPLAGPFAMAAVAYAVAGLILTVWLRPDPLLTARALERADVRAAGHLAATHGTDHRAVRLGGLTMVVTQFAMVAVMTMTPIHMRGHGHGLAATGLVIAIHIGGMYLPSPVSGRLADRYGSKVTAALAGASLLTAGLIAATAPPHFSGSSLPLAGAAWSGLEPGSSRRHRLGRRCSES